MKDMSITFFTIKGGVGKTTLSVQVAQMLGYDYITNDGHSAVVDLLDEDRALLVSESEKEIPFFKNVVYDFGGFKDLRIKNIICPISTFKRVVKYTKRGYYINTFMIVHLFNNFRNIDSSDDFFKQLDSIMNDSEESDETLYEFLRRYHID